MKLDTPEKIKEFLLQNPESTFVDSEDNEYTTLSVFNSKR
jgi:hypothetical protein